MVVAGAAVAGALLVVFGGLVAFVRFGGPLDQVPGDHEMPSASEVPVPEGLELVDGRCTGGNAGCYKGIQQFELVAVGSSGDGVLRCDEFALGLLSAGWSRAEVADLSVEESYLGPGGGVAANCEVSVVRDERTSTVTIAWPGRVEFLPFNP